MRFYEEGFIPNGFTPDWDYWVRNEVQELDYLVEVSLGVNMSMVNELAKWGINHHDFHLLGLSGKSVPAMIDIRNKMLTSIKGISDWVKNDIFEGELERQPSNNSENCRLKTRDYIEWLDKKKIPYPDEMKDYLKSITSLEDSQLSSGDKSKVTQENTTLKILFNKMVRLHYDGNVTVYTIVKDMRSKGISAHKNTIKTQTSILALRDTIGGISRLRHF